MDHVDDAQNEIEHAVRAALARRVELPAAIATGRCLTCDEPLGDRRRWCDAECRDEWERRNANAVPD